MTEAGFDDAKEVQTKTLLGRMGDANDDINGAGTNKLTAAGSRKGEAGVLPMLVIVIAGGRSTKNTAFIIDVIVGIGFVSINAISAGIKRVVEGKVVEALTRRRNADKKPASWEPEE